MQYILSEKEYKELLDGNGNDVRVNKKKLQKLCSLAANHIPVDRDWDKERKDPWMCEVGTPKGEYWEEQICDECPCVNICPYEHKDFSK